MAKRKWTNYCLLEVEYVGASIEAPTKYKVFYKDETNDVYTNITFMDIIDMMSDGTVLYVDDLPRIWGFYKKSIQIDEALPHYFYDTNTPQRFTIGKVYIKDLSKLKLQGIKQLNSFISKYNSLSEVPNSLGDKVRKEFRPLMMSAWKYESKRKFKDDELLSHVYVGGDCGMVGAIHDNLMSFDRTSAYISELISKQYPTAEFIDMPEDLVEEEDLINPYIITVKYKDLMCIGKNASIFTEWIDEGECYVDKNRVAYAKEIQLTMTSLDYETVDKFYKYSSKEIICYYICYSWNYLPDIVRKKAFDMFQGRKSNPELKRDCAIVYGLFCNDPTKSEEEDKNDYFPFRVGVFCSAYARKALNDLIYKVKEDIVYWDTDCVKCLCNDKIYEIIAETNKALSIEFQGQKTLLGQFKDEGISEYYIYGIKKYIKDDVPTYAGATIPKEKMPADHHVYKSAYIVRLPNDYPVDVDGQHFETHLVTYRTDLEIKKLSEKEFLEAWI